MVAARRPLAEGVVALELEAADHADLPAWRPGAHIDLVFGPDRLIRQYSLCGDPADLRRWTIGVLREENGRGGSAYLHDALREGDLVEARPPHNSFALTHGRPVVFIAGGMGITPLLPMMAALEADGAPWRLHYAGRSRSHMAFADSLSASFGPKASLYAKAEGQRLDIDAALAGLDPATLVYACGPSRMLDAVKAASAAHGLEARVERFATPDSPRGTSGPDKAFEVRLARSGVTFTVAPGETILDRAAEEGVLVDCSCLEGICGTCETRVLEGEPDHRDYVLDGDPKDRLMICVSRCKGPRLVLDA